MSVPKSLQPAFDGIEPLITDYCNQYLNDEYRELCLHLLEKLCRKRPSPLLAGRKNTCGGYRADQSLQARGHRCHAGLRRSRASPRKRREGNPPKR